MATGIFSSVSFMWSLRRRERHRHAACTEKVENKEHLALQLCFHLPAVDRDAFHAHQRDVADGVRLLSNFLLILSQTVFQMLFAIAMRSAASELVIGLNFHLTAKAHVDNDALTQTCKPTSKMRSTTCWSSGRKSKPSTWSVTSRS